MTTAPTVRDSNRQVLLASSGPDWSALDVGTLAGTQTSPTLATAGQALEAQLDFLDKNRIDLGELSTPTAASLTDWPMTGHLLVMEGARIASSDADYTKYCRNFVAGFTPTEGATAVSVAPQEHPRPGPSGTTTETYHAVVGQADSWLSTKAGGSGAIQYFPTPDEDEDQQFSKTYNERITFGPVFDYWCFDNTRTGRADLYVFIVGTADRDD